MPAWITSLLREETPLPMPRVRLGDDHLVAGERRGARHRKPDHACADDEDLHGLTPCLTPLRRERFYSFAVALSTPSR